MAHLITMAMALCDVPISFHTDPPTVTSIRAYVAGRSACPSGTQSPTPEGEEVSQSPPSDPTLMGGLHMTSTWT